MNLKTIIGKTVTSYYISVSSFKAKNYQDLLRLGNCEDTM